jgi:hypothetical protein
MYWYAVLNGIVPKNISLLYMQMSSAHVEQGG